MTRGTCDGIGAVDDITDAVMMCPTCGGDPDHFTTRLRSAMHRLHWSAQTVATVGKFNERTVRRWLIGQNPTPEGVLEWLELLAAFVDANPGPRRKPGRSGD